MNRRTLTESQRRRLERQLKETSDARVYRRTLAVLEYSHGRPVVQIAELVGATRQSIHNWIEAYFQSGDPSALLEGVRTGRPSVWTQERRALLEALLDTSPDQLGYLTVNWTVPLLQDQIERATGPRLCDDTVRNELRRMDYVWKRPRYRLEPDPDEDKKTQDTAPNPHVESQDPLVGPG